jgi:hypothetical protein
MGAVLTIAAALWRQTVSGPGHRDRRGEQRGRHARRRWRTSTRHWRDHSDGRELTDEERREDGIDPERSLSGEPQLDVFE